MYSPSIKYEENAPEEIASRQLFTRLKYGLSYEIENELWYYPIPLEDVKVRASVRD